MRKFIVVYLVVMIALFYQTYTLIDLGVKSPSLFIVSELVIITGIITFHTMGEQHKDD